MEKLINKALNAEYPEIRLYNMYASLKDWQKVEFMNELIKNYEKANK
jgi:hypothetical protein